MKIILYLCTGKEQLEYDGEDSGEQ
jgi:hypothetical protein